MELDIFRLDDGAFAERANRRADPEMQIPERAGELGNGGLAGSLPGFIFEEEEEVNIRTGEKHAAAITAGCCDTSFHGRNGGETMFHKLSDDAVSEPAAPGQRGASVAGGLKRPADVRGFFCAELSEIRKRNDGRHANRSAPWRRGILERALAAFVVADADGFLDAGEKNLAVADFSGLRGFQNRFDGG